MSLAIDRLSQSGPWRERALAEKAVLAFGLLALALVLPPWPGGALVLVAAWALALGGARIALVDWLRLNAMPLGFVLTGALTLAVDVDAQGLHLAADQGLRAVQVVLRASAAVSALLLLAATTPAPDLVRGLRRLGLSAEIAEIMLLSWHFLFLLQDQAAAIHTAQEARLGWFGHGRQIRSLGMLIAQLLPRAMERARRLEVGLAARGFNGSLPMMSFARPASGKVLALIVGAEILLAGVSLWLA
ncbi:Transmembrane component CbiQ of energizing module of cobalt ECF transporter [Paramagnetospirillum magnetotacticum MS-1]|uniref:Transmembrane component CbiQ of energizing module of cobalt ECF transporter n=1 Tax=Paramagnetospirillum magnetotacticum MS-1 TaxID=272627 RepID=A0A0C2UZD1_PARME|nr:cobalt ECF transporter T component CbiQ [Paramagnetospirillum magnetotacticum]KIL98171.1 Transmembrane component CbiQ of energizing module of cobalt ECF transporter [Paramagnetospirillum magnetotacticum MS-1]